MTRIRDRLIHSVRQADPQTSCFEKLTYNVAALVEVLYENNTINKEDLANIGFHDKPTPDPKPQSFTAQQLRNKKNGLFRSYDNVEQVINTTMDHETRITALLTANTVLEQLAKELESNG